MYWYLYNFTGIGGLVVFGRVSFDRFLVVNL